MSKNSEKIESIESTWTVLPEKPAGPFLLDVTPEKLVVPSTGNLEVKIRNPTKETCKVYVSFDSFFWLMKKENEEFRKGCGDSSSMCSFTTFLAPGSTTTFTIGYHDAKYVTYIRDIDAQRICDIEICEQPCPEHQGRVVEVPPSERFYYNHERPEGFLVVEYEVKEAKNSGNPMRRMDLYLKDETEEYKKYREQFEEIRKEQARRARWGHVLVNRDCITERKFRDLDGTIRDYGSRWEKETEWERDILPDLKQLDGFSDEQILKIRKERKEKIDEKHRKEEEDDKKRAEEYKKEQEEKRKKEEEEERIKKEEEEMKKKKEKEEAAAAKEKSKVKTVEKSKRPEEPSQNVQKSTKSNVSVAPPKVNVTPTNNKPVEKPNATKNKKKKKANPCCSVM